jgi:signal transduction histidine kinase
MINRKVAVIASTVIVGIIIVDLLTTRQVLPYTNVSETGIFILTVVGAYGICSWILFEYTKKISEQLRTRSRFINTMHWAVTVTQFSLLGFLFFIVYNNSLNCADYFSLCNTDNYARPSIDAVSAIGATVIMGLIGYKFFSWYRSSKRNFMLLFYGLACAALGFSIAGDAIDKILLIQVVDEKSPPGIVPGASFIYKTFPKYHGEIEYKVANPHTTRLYVVPSEKLDLYNQIIYFTSDAPYVLTWAGTFFLLRYHYQKTGKPRKNLMFWTVVAIPLILYLVGSGLIFSLPADIPYKFIYRLIFRAGTIGSSVLFGLAFFTVIRNLNVTKVKDYLAISAMGIIMIGIANEVSALQQTYGVAAHSLVLLSSYLFAIGLYSASLSISQDRSIRELIKKSALEDSKVLAILGPARLEDEISRRALNVAKDQQIAMTEKTGIYSSLTDQEMKLYLSNVLKEIKVLRDIKEIITKGKVILESSAEFLVCSKLGGLRLAYNNYFETYKKIMEKRERREHNGIRVVTTIDKDTKDLIKTFLGIGVEIRHAQNMPPIDFAVSDKEMIATIEKTEGGEMVRSLLVSNERPYIAHFVSIFEELWKEAIDARERIGVIEEGLEPEFLEVINDREKASQTLLSMAKSVRAEALLLLPNEKALVRADRLGLIDRLIQASNAGAEVKIICPLGPQNSEVVDRIRQNSQTIMVLNGNEVAAGMLIVDSKEIFRADLKDPTAESITASIGFSIYSNSRATVDSFKSFFELHWNERTLNEELRRTDKIQKEFINIAAHELRTPIQPIIGLSEILRSSGSKIDSAEQKHLLDVVVRNARRLQRLTEDILDITRIESGSLVLKKEKLDIYELLVNAIDDSKNIIVNQNKTDKIKIHLSTPLERIDIEGDKERLYRVISNLLSNAIEFTKEGIISVSAILQGHGKEKPNEERQAEGQYGFTEDRNHHREQVLISVTDSGGGVDPEILPRLFTKFATKSATGTGLGLYISKSIVEAHGGRIWAKNNSIKEGTSGATFSFTIPILKSIEKFNKVNS